MKFSLKNFGLATIAIAALSTSSCKKETVNPVAPALTNEQFTSARMNYLDVQTILNEAIATGNVSFKTEGALLTNGCAAITSDTMANPHTVLIDFGDACTGSDGKVRGGQIYATYNNTDLSLTGTVINAVFYDYTVDGDTIGGSIDLTNNGPGPNADMEGTIVVNSNISFEGNAGNLEGVFNYDLWFDDLSTPGRPEDDAFLFLGSGSGYTTGGRAFTQQINVPLIRSRAVGCNFFVYGEVNVDVAGESTRTFNYGDGTCDNLATVTQDGVTQTITLH